MELGQYGWTRNLSYYQTHPEFIISAPPATPNYGLINLGNAPFDGVSSGKFAGSTPGTYLAINAASGFTGDFSRYQLAGADRFEFDYTGQFTITNPNAGSVFPILIIGSPGAGIANSVNLQLGNISPGTRNTQIIFGKGGITNVWYVGSDLNHNDGQDFFIFDGTTSTRFYIDPAGNTVLGGNLPSGSITALGTLDVRISPATTKGIVVTGASGQSANLHEWYDSSSNLLSSVNSKGQLSLSAQPDIQALVWMEVPA